MKKTYEKLVIDIVVFEKKDVITASAQETDHDNGYIDFSDFFSTFFVS